MSPLKSIFKVHWCLRVRPNQHTKNGLYTTLCSDITMNQLSLVEIIYREYLHHRHQRIPQIRLPPR